MRFLSIAVAVLPALVSAHTIAQRVRVNGQDFGQGNGIRVAPSNNPITNVNDGNLACNANPSSSSKVIDIKPGDKVGVMWGHVVGGAQFANDPDHPIAKSHKGPAIFYMAKVSNAATVSPSGLAWFKVSEDGLDSSGNWGVDRMLNNGGWTEMTMPSCVAPGQYLLRAEMIALHSASTTGGAQFYVGCAQINVSGSGSKAGNTVGFPGAYSANDPGIKLSIYNAQGQPKGNGTPYQIPGPAKLQC
ncbi:Glycoside hydrolase family 61 protein [Pyrenophora tritici-repentis]|uniref:AA9 family lytic polysaccharide monooxygenase n=2 Tax=Pyrenophora tritici-repentis TaxID=45151 RepID=A0A2W1ELA1_9PLEO|nr:endoglucanase II [Pyrenophora tritici-repentis Pt-1C-BFP]KAA8613378.1 Glycoside hydrolase family 61 protein [Pyrenophora tritici-repentis]EDU49239.1 endoglucanase II [Pyrenophora tritici-repentis Pt-1C-BFP]KAF7445088.1 Glycoside hydrolase family 61 protein [Pyrenophora tritici-repentis]KAF7565358.1 Glyco-hydro-61 domain containing protein [Pyrenophora tritici-repentis]KAG9380506.1 Glycoside hydrolase family 61 protein [Pyrenophora tritici-repentis]